jgi:putative flippase GtrA
MDFLRDTLRRNRQFALYCVIGVTGVTLDFLVYSLLVRYANLNVQAANAIGYSSGTVLSFVLNSRFNFKTRDWITLRFISFCVVAFLGWSASATTLSVLINRYGCNKYLAKFLTTFVVVLVQYTLNRAISFRQSPSATDE